MRGSEWENFGSPSSRTDDGGQGRQIHFLPPVKLMSFAGNAEATNGDVSFRVETPDSRLRVNIAIIGKPLTGNSPTFIGTKGLTLWLRAVEDAVQGGDEIPITNLWGTSAAFGPIPGELNSSGVPVAVTTLGGFGKEFETAGKAIVGTVHYGASVNTGRGQLILQVRYFPVGFRFPRDEWEEIKSQCDATVKGYPLDGGG